MRMLSFCFATLPELGSRLPAMICSWVVLPAPLMPARAHLHVWVVHYHSPSHEFGWFTIIHKPTSIWTAGGARIAVLQHN